MMARQEGFLVRPEDAEVDNSSVSLADGRQHLCSDWQFPKWTRWRTPVRVSSMRYRAAVRSPAARKCTAAKRCGDDTARSSPPPILAEVASPASRKGLRFGAAVKSTGRSLCQ